MILDGMEKKHLKAKEHLREARNFAKWSENDRKERLPPLTNEQRKQLQSYLDLIAEREFGEKNENWVSNHVIYSDSFDIVDEKE